MVETAAPLRPVWGLSGFILGAASLALALLVMNGAFDAPAKSAATTIGEFAAEIRNSAKAALSGAPSAAEAGQAPVSRSMDARELAQVGVAGLAFLAAAFGAIGLFRHERKQLPLLAIGAGASAVILQFAVWLAMLICGVILITVIVRNLNSIFGFSLFDIFSS